MAFGMSDFWDEDPDVRRYWIEEDAGWLFRTSLVADERYSFGEHAWVPVDFYEVISNTCNGIIQVSEEKMVAIISEREMEIAARERDSDPEKRPQWGKAQWKRFFGG